MTLSAAYITHSGSDLLVANAARVSFDKHHTELVVGGHMGSDDRLIASLARDGHWTPFAHPTITLHLTAPIFVRAQCFKHKVGFTENEVSRRYVDGPPEIACPSEWRARAPFKKQGSGPPLLEKDNRAASRIFGEFACRAIAAYSDLLDLGVAPEQARAVLPLATLTEWYWTGSLSAWARFYNLRTAPSAQAETAELARACAVHIASLFPISWKALTAP